MKFSKIVWGLLCIVAAGIIVLGVFGLLGEMNTWTLLISIPIVAGIVICAVKFEWGGMFLLMALLAFIYRRNIENILDISISVWALAVIALLLSIGFYILFGKKNKKFVHWHGTRDVGIEDYDSENVTGEKIYFEEQFTGASKYISSENLSYVSIKNRFGGMEVYFEKATLSPEGAVVNIENSFGGVELYVPRGWNIVEQINNFAGGTDCPNIAHIEGAPTITIRGNNSFGGVDIELV